MLLCRHVRRKISANVDGGLSEVSRCADTGVRTPIGVSGILLLFRMGVQESILEVTEAILDFPEAILCKNENKANSAQIG